MAALVRLALDSGARLGETLALRWSGVDGRSVRFARTASTARLPEDERKLRFDTPKNGKSRTVEIDAVRVAVLSVLRERQAVEPIADVWANSSSGDRRGRGPCRGGRT
jgi:integrase